uniref:40S ribosomal protein S21 n=1 Tax=Oryzias latipes TaxID=8090 RepID=A0A3P9K736_ORYLA
MYLPSCGVITVIVSPAGGDEASSVFSLHFRFRVVLPFLSAICRERFEGDHFELKHAERRWRICGPVRPAKMVDKVTGRFNGQFKTYAICGAIRRMGESDDSILRLAKNDTIVAKNI